MSSLNHRAPWRGQISAAGLLIGCIGCAISTASSVYTANTWGALPGPTIFTSITAGVRLRAAGRTSLNEANVTPIILSAGSRVAGGLAFTIPGVWMLGLDAELSWIEIGGVALAGTLLGLVCTALIRRRFVEESDLEYPIGTERPARRGAWRRGARKRPRTSARQARRRHARPVRGHRGPAHLPRPRDLPARLPRRGHSRVRHHHHERAVGGSDGPRPHGDLRPHRPAQRRRARRQPRGGHRPVLPGYSVHDARPRRVPAVLHDALRFSRRPGQGRLCSFASSSGSPRSPASSWSF